MPTDPDSCIVLWYWWKNTAPITHTQYKREVLKTSAFVLELLFSRLPVAHCILIKQHYLPNHIKVPLIINHHQNLIWWLYIQ